MKKIYAIMVAAVMSVSLFAAPSQGDLASYMEEGYYVVCFQAPADATCNDIYWMGQYADWNIATALEDLVKCEPLTGANAGWYVAKVPADKGTNGKPIQLNECGKMTWDVQPGSHDKIKLEAGSVNIIDKGAETDLEGFSTTEPTILTIAGWKNDYNPCEKVCDQQSYTIRIYPPYCEYLEDLEPTIMGSFNGWSEAITMEFKGSYFEYVTEPVLASFEFKFNNDPKGTWTHEFSYYDEENDATTGVPASGNLSLTNGTEFYTYDATNRILTFDFSDDTKFQYGGCEEQVETPKENVLVSAKLPAGAPAAGVEIIGTFDAWAGTALTNVDGVWGAAIQASENEYFKFREAGSWNNEILLYDEAVEGDDKWRTIKDEELTFGKLWADGTGDQAGSKVINLDYSNANNYKWKVPGEATGIENVVLTEKAQKVVVNGVLYIVRDNKMFNVQGTQVR